jgi:6-phosphofructokinase 1
VELVAAGQFGQMVALQGREIVAVPIADATRNLKQVDPNGEFVREAESLGIMMGR